MDDEIYHFDSDQRIESISFGSNAMQVQRSLTLPAIPSADENDRKNKRRTFHSEERTIVKHPNPYLLKVWKSRWLSEKQEDKKLVFKVDYATPDVVRRMKAVYGANLFSFFPKTYILPKDYPRLISQYMEISEWNQCVKNQLKRSARLSPRKSSGNRRDSSLASDSTSSKNADGKGDWVTKRRGRRNSSPSKTGNYTTTSNSNSSSGIDKNNYSKTTSKNTKSYKSNCIKINGFKGARSGNKNGNRGDSSDNQSTKTTSSSNNDSPASFKSETKNELKNSKIKKDTKIKEETESEKKDQGKGDGEGEQNNEKEDKNSEKNSEKKVSKVEMKKMGKKTGNKNENSSLQNKLSIDVKTDCDDGWRRKKSSSESTNKQSLQGGITWIAKPSSNSQGRGIHIIKDLNDLKFNTSTVVQRYIDNPMLISGYKFDLRLYVIIASFHPLTIYLYREGLVRFATDKFDMNELTNVYAHLTNTSINKCSPSYSDAKDSVGPGCIWALSRLRAYLENQSSSLKKHPAFTWHKISNIISLTLLTLSNHISPQAYNCFELLGFDILLDDMMKPWLLEVNISPALTTNTYLDAHVKLGVLRHTVFLCEKLFFTEADDQDDYNGNQELTIYKYHRVTAGKKRSRNAIRSHTSEFFQPRVGIFSKNKYQKSIPASLGDLSLIFPFNDETRKATSTELHDTRTAILEIQKRDAIVQRRLETYSAKKTTTSIHQKIENLLLWCP